MFLLKYSTELPYCGPNQMDEMWGSLRLYCWPLARVFVAMGTTAKELYGGGKQRKGRELWKDIRKATQLLQNKRQSISDACEPFGPKRFI